MTKTICRAAAFLGCAVLFSSCGLFRHGTQTIIEYRDSTIIRDHFVYDTVEVKVPEIIERNVTRDTASHLENAWGKSDALVTGGLLWHSLETIPRTIEVPVAVEVHDTLTVIKQAETHTQTIEVEKPLTWWQRLKIGAFWWLISAVAGLLIWTFRKFLFKIP